MHLVRAAAEEVRLAVVAVAEGVVVVEDEVEVVEEVNDDGRVRHHEEPRGLRAAVDVLTPDVQGRRKHAPGLPPDSLLPTAPRIPDDALALAAQNVHDLFEQVALGFRLSARRDLAEVADVDALAADKVNVSAAHASAQALPGLDLRRAQVGDVVVLIDR